MIDVLSALQQMYYLDRGKAHDAILLACLREYNRGAREAARIGKPKLAKVKASARVVALLKAYEDDPCAVALREMLGIKKEVVGKVFRQCQARRMNAPDWINPHGWRIKKWPSFLPYIHPTATKE
jgi:hypothetical protein